MSHNPDDDDDSSQEEFLFDSFISTQTNLSGDESSPDVSISEDCGHDTDYDSEPLDTINENITISNPDYGNTSDLSTETQPQADIRISRTHGMQ